MNTRNLNFRFLYEYKGTPVSKWPGKYVIGLTGNIASGKSLVRKMLEHLGAYGIDADALSHRAISKGAPGYKPVVDQFGRWILGPDGQIDRVRLGKIVFSDPEALKHLEGIVHPLVTMAIDWLIQRSIQNVIVIEAIKLIEAGISQNCDSLWVVYAPPEVQLSRLMQIRKMDEVEARRRITSQPPYEIKLAIAGQVIKNNTTITDTWRQVSAAWQKSVPPVVDQPPVKAVSTIEGELTIEKGRSRHAEEIASLFTRLSHDHRSFTAEDILNAFGEKAFLLLELDHKLVGLIGWQVENLVARTTDIYLDPSIPVSAGLPPLLNEMEHSAKDLQCEASLIFIPPDQMKNYAIWKKLGYELSSPTSLLVQAWQEAAIDSTVPDTVMLFKQLREERILRPI
jgi:dephospho-CoA kinase